MIALQQATSWHGFQARWELNEKMATRNITSETKAVNGMPDVKWYLKRTYSCADGYTQLNLNIDSKDSISYQCHLNDFRYSDRVRNRFNGTSIGQKEIFLCGDKNLNFQSQATDGKLIISVNGYFSYTTQEPVSNNLCTAAEFGLRLKENYPKDFDICVDGQVIQIHKHFVAAESPVFAKMFESNFNEAAEKKVEITDANYEIVQAAIDYCYRQDISGFLQDLTNSINLLYFCDKYDFQTLKPILEDHLSKKFMSKEYISLLVSNADQTNALQLRQACINFMCGLLKKSEEFSAEEIAKFDSSFKNDVLFQALN